MMCYPPTGYIVFSLKKLKFYGGRGPGNPNTLFKHLCSLLFEGRMYGN